MRRSIERFLSCYSAAILARVQRLPQSSVHTLTLSVDVHCTTHSSRVDLEIIDAQLTVSGQVWYATQQRILPVHLHQQDTITFIFHVQQKPLQEHNDGLARFDTHGNGVEQGVARLILEGRLLDHVASLPPLTSITSYRGIWTLPTWVSSVNPRQMLAKQTSQIGVPGQAPHAIQAHIGLNSRTLTMSRKHREGSHLLAAWQAHEGKSSTTARSEKADELPTPNVRPKHPARSSSDLLLHAKRSARVHTTSSPLRPGTHRTLSATGMSSLDARELSSLSASVSANAAPCRRPNSAEDDCHKSPAVKYYSRHLTLSNTGPATQWVISANSMKMSANEPTALTRGKLGLAFGEESPPAAANSMRVKLLDVFAIEIWVRNKNTPLQETVVRILDLQYPEKYALAVVTQPAVVVG